MSSPQSPSALDRARSKAYLRLLPLLFVCYVIAYVDRVNVGFAKLNMQGDLAHLGFSESVFGFGMGIFFVGYLLLEIPGTLLVEKWSARKWISRIMISWGIIAAMTAFVHYRVPGATAMAEWIVATISTLLEPLARADLGWLSRQAQGLVTELTWAGICLCVPVLGRPLPAWPGRGWLLPWRDCLPDSLVPAPGPLTGTCLVLHRHPGCADHRTTDLRGDHGHWRGGQSADSRPGRAGNGSTSSGASRPSSWALSSSRC